MPSERSLDIDTAFDLQLASLLLGPDEGSIAVLQRALGMLRGLQGAISHGWRALVWTSSETMEHSG
jgi:hypothetical protein